MSLPATDTMCLRCRQWVGDDHVCGRAANDSEDRPSGSGLAPHYPQAPARQEPPPVVSVPRAPTGGGVLSVREAPQLPAIERVKALLAECITVDEAKEIRDQAVAVTAYYRQRADALEIQNDAAEIRLRAERRLGELLAVMPMRPGHRFGDAGGDHREQPAALEDIGITRKQSSVWQRIAALATEDFEARIADLKENGIEVTTTKILKAAPPSEMADGADPKAPASSSLPKPDDDADAEDLARDLIDRLGPLKAQDLADEINRQLHT